MYMQHRINTANADMNMMVANALLKIMAPVPAIIIMLVNCNEINVPAFIIHYLLCYLSKFQYIILSLPFVDGPAISVAWSMYLLLQRSVTIPISSLLCDT